MSALLTSVSFFSLRMRPGALVPIKWRFPECPRLILPFAVNLKRFLAPRCVFNFNFGFDLFLGIYVHPLDNLYGRLPRRGKPRPYKTVSLCAPAASTRRREIPHIRRPTLSRERKRKKKSACSVRNDGKGELLRLLRLLGAGSRLPCGLCNRNTFFRRQQSDEDIAFHSGHGFDLALVANFHEQAVHLGAADFLVRHFAPAMENHRAHFVALAEKADNLVFANLIIVLRGGGPKLDFLELRGAAALALLVGLFIELVKVFAVVGNLANRRNGGGRDFHQIESPLARQLHGFKRLHDAKLAAIFINHPDLARPNPLVYADPVTLPEVPFSDKSPLKELFCLRPRSGRLNPARTAEKSLGTGFKV